MVVKLIAIDLDGTLLDSSGRLSKVNLEAIHYAERQGAKVVLCTGRPYLAMKEFVTKIGFTHPEDYIITFNGGQTQKAATGEVILSDTLSVEDMLIWQTELDRLHLPMNIIDQEYVYEPLVYPETYPSLYVKRGNRTPVKTKDFKTFDVNHHFNKFVVGTDADHLDKQSKQVSSELLDVYSLTFSYPWLMEISKHGVNKGAALSNLARELNIDIADTMAIGDQLNDLSMVKMAGVGVAMENAVQEVKAQADFITKLNDDHGVAHAIYHFL